MMQGTRDRNVFLAVAPFLIFLSVFPFAVQAQVNTVEFGKNRIQYKKFDWKFYQSANFNSYFNQGGLELGKYTAQVAEEELPGIEAETEYSFQRRANLVVYNNYDDYKSSNIGLGIDWMNAGGTTKLVNNKVILYFDGNHAHFRRAVREGIARILVDNLLFGDDIGEIASNQALLDLPKWLTDGYVEYVAEHWSPEKDDDLRSAILSGDYRTFYQFAFDKPLLAGHAFWYYISERYRKENVTYFLYLARLYKNLNSASQRITKKKFKEVLTDFMDYEQEKYSKDLRQRRNAVRGRLSVVEDIRKADYFRFQANPSPRDNSYAVVEYKQGVYTAKVIDNLYEPKTLLKYGVKIYNGTINPNYPIMAWDGKGSRLLVIWFKEGKTMMFVYDMIARVKRFQQEIKGFDQILDAGFMLDANTLLLSAVKNGHSDLYTYSINNERVIQVTNDVYDDLDPTFVAFPNRVGIIFASNRPGPEPPLGDTVIPGRSHFNIFLVDINNKSQIKQISQLTNMKYGDARYPMQYNTNHFTFVSQENGIANRWAGFFSTARNGLDTLYYIGDELLRNPSIKEMDSTLRIWQKHEPDSVSYFQVYKDSTYTFPITNYQSSLIETRIAGDRGQVSEVRREGDLKFLYKLRVDSNTLRRRNVNARPTDYMRKLVAEDRAAQGKPVITPPPQPGKSGAPVTAPPADTTRRRRPSGFQTEFGDAPDTTRPASREVFQNEFQDTRPDSVRRPASPVGNSPLAAKRSVLASAGLYNYGLKFSTDYLVAGITNNILINRFQPYAGGAGPIELNNGNDINYTFRVGVSDLMEDIKFIGGFRLGSDITDKDVFLSFQNLRKRVDWGFTYYRSNTKNYPNFFQGNLADYDNMLVTNLYQVNASFPLNEVKSIRATIGLRQDRGIIRPFNAFTGDPDPTALAYGDSVSSTIVSRIEYVHDNTIYPAQNIWNGLRYKFYLDFDFPVSAGPQKGKKIFNFGFDARNYTKIYRNFIWAVRAAGDFSFGDQRIVYYLGGVDGWVGPKFNAANNPDPSQQYAFQSLAVNMRGYNQNLANGNNAMVINSELRLPVFSTFLNKPINNAFIRNFQVVQFVDFGSAWTGAPWKIARPTDVFGPVTANNPVVVKIRAGGIGPFAGGYGFGVRSTLLGYFLKLDAGWPMNGFFLGKPTLYFALGLDF